MHEPLRGNLRSTAKICRTEHHLLHADVGKILKIEVAIHHPIVHGDIDGLELNIADGVAATAATKAANGGAIAKGGVRTILMRIGDAEVLENNGRPISIKAMPYGAVASVIGAKGVLNEHVALDIGACIVVGELVTGELIGSRMMIGDGDIHVGRRPVQLPQADQKPGTGIPRREAVCNVDIGHRVVGGIGLYIYARLGGGAAGIGEVTILNNDVHAADQAEPLAEIAIEDGVGDGDVLTGASCAVTDEQAVTAGLIAGDPADGYVAGPFEIKAMAPLAVVGGVLGDVLRFAHLEDDAASSGALDSDVLRCDIEHFLNRSEAGIGGYRDARIEDDLGIIGEGDGAYVVATRGYPQDLAIGGGIVQGILKDAGVVTTVACVAKCEQARLGRAGSGDGGVCGAGG